MPLIVEDGSGVPDADSYVSTAYARAFAASVGVALPSDDTALEAALRAGALYVDAQPFSGQAASADQALAWPRKLASLRGYPLDSNVIPELLKKAQVIAAALNPNGLDVSVTVTAGAIKREKVGPIETEYYDSGVSTVLTYSAIDNLLAPLLNYVGGYRLSPSFGF